MLVAAGLSVAGLVSLGLPGFAILAAATGPARMLGAPELGGDQVWPAALAISTLGPVPLIPVYLCLARMVGSRLSCFLLTIAATLAIDVALSCAGLLVFPTL